MKPLVWLFVFLVAFLVHLALERLNLVDSIGLWYTLYGAAISTALFFAAFMVVRYVFRKIRQRRA
jgi:hypothetical protein